MIDKGDSKHEKQAIGQKLREAREHRKLSLQEVEQSLHIYAHQLEALERGNYEAFPNLGWARGFLIRYGTYLGLDGERLAGQAFPVRRTSRPMRFLRRRWRGLVTAGGTIALVAVFIVTSIVFPNNPFTGDPITGRVADFLARVAPGTFLASGPQRVAIFGYAQSSINGKDTVLVAEVAEEDLGVLAVPADTPARIPGHGQGDIGEVVAMDRPELTRQTVAGLTAKEVQHYVAVTPGGIREIVDSMGGVQIDVPNPVSGRAAPEGPEITLSPGRQKLDGAQALVYLQARDLRGGAEILKRQQTFLYTMFRQALGVSNLLASPDTFVELSENVETDMRWIQEAQLVARILKLKGKDETLEINVLNDP
jgi:LCP family protein required for cell wall assembly